MYVLIEKYQIKSSKVT